MAQKPTKTKQPAKPHSAERDAKGPPTGKYYGEPNPGEQKRDEGSLEKETLDPDAPYNKTYGREPDDDSAKGE